MCGRITCYEDPEDIKAEIKVSLGSERLTEFKPSYNIPPTFNILIVRPIKGGLMLDAAKWGLVPRWSKEPTTKYSTFNARAETVVEKSSFKQAFKDSRCLVLANGYYEWDKDKNPFYFTRSDGNLITFAGLYEIWNDQLLSCTIITTHANEKTSTVHSRMPVVLEKEQYETWFSDNLHSAKELLTPAQPDVLDFRQVDKALGNPKNNSSSLIN